MQWAVGMMHVMEGVMYSVMGMMYVVVVVMEMMGRTGRGEAVVMHAGI